MAKGNNQSQCGVHPKIHGSKKKQSHQSMASLAICIFCCRYNEALADNRLWGIHPGLNSVCSCTFKAVLLRFAYVYCIGTLWCELVYTEYSSEDINIWNDFNYKKGRGENCTSWPKAIKGTLISLAIMLWGILNSVISACYIWRKVSGNCFVLLEQKKKKEKLLKWVRDDHLAVRFPAICTQAQVLLLVPTPDSQKFFFFTSAD